MHKSPGTWWGSGSCSHSKCEHQLRFPWPEPLTKWAPSSVELEAKVRALNEGQSVHIKITAASKPSSPCVFRGKKDTTEERGIWHFSRKTKVAKPETSVQKKENIKELFRIIKEKQMHNEWLWKVGISNIDTVINKILKEKHRKSKIRSWGWDLAVHLGDSHRIMFATGKEPTEGCAVKA